MRWWVSEEGNVVTLKKVNLATLMFWDCIEDILQDGSITTEDMAELYLVNQQFWRSTMEQDPELQSAIGRELLNDKAP